MNDKRRQKCINKVWSVVSISLASGIRRMCVWNKRLGAANPCLVVTDTVTDTIVPGMCTAPLLQYNLLYELPVTWPLFNDRMLNVECWKHIEVNKKHNILGSSERRKMGVVYSLLSTSCPPWGSVSTEEVKEANCIVSLCIIFQLSKHKNVTPHFCRRKTIVRLRTCKHSWVVFTHWSDLAGGSSRRVADQISPHIAFYCPQLLASTQQKVGQLNIKISLDSV